jgi:hypothetical protein
MRILRINEKTYSDLDIQDWFTQNCRFIFPSNFNSNIEIKEDGVHVKKPITFYQMKTPPPFKISFLEGNIKIQSSIIDDFSFFPKTLNGGLEIIDTDIKSMYGFPTMIQGNLELNNCGVIESFGDVESTINGSININLITSLKELKAGNIKFMGSGLIIRGTKITSLVGLPSYSRLDPNKSPYFHISDCNIKNLIGLPEKVSNLYVSKCPLESIEGIPFDIKEDFDITPSIQGDRKKVLKEIDLYVDALERFPFVSNSSSNPEDDRASYIKKILEANPEYTSIIPSEEIPNDLKGNRILKRLRIF